MHLLEYFLDPDSPSIQEAEKSILWLYDKPEIVAALKDAYRLHKRPLKIVVGEIITDSGYDHQAHTIEMNSEGWF